MLALAALTIASGCSMDESDVVRRDNDKMQAQVEKRSSQILDIISLEGKVTESGAAVAPCSDYPSEDNVHRIRHPWSLYGVPVAKMQEAMDRLRNKLPQHGWKIVKDGTDSSRARSPQIVANSTDGAFSVDIKLWAEPKSSEHKSLIVVTVVSTCYKSR